MSDKKPSSSPAVVAVLSALEYIVAVTAVVAAIGALAEAARRMDARPVAAGADGVITLIPWDAALDGDVSLSPTLLEEQIDNFSYHFGRELLAERQGRHVAVWRAGGSVSWDLHVPTPDVYQLEIWYDDSAATGSAAEVGGEYEVTIDGAGATYRIEASSTAESEGGEVGAVFVGAGCRFAGSGTARVTLTALEVPGTCLMRLKRVLLHPPPTG